MATAPQSPLTAEEFACRPDPGYPEELILGNHVETHDLGYVLNSDSGVITERDLDTVRGPDVTFYSYVRVPKGTLPRDRYLDVPPELAVEVLSPDDRWPKVLAKAAEYLDARVAVVAVLNPERRTLHLFTADEPVRVLAEDDELTLPVPLGDFRVAVRRFFD